MRPIKLNPRIGFYAVSEELAQWVRGWVRDYPVHYVFARNFAKYAETQGLAWNGEHNEIYRAFASNYPTFGLTQEVDWDNPKQVLQVVRSYETLHFRLEPIDTNVRGINLLPIQGPDYLSIHLPQRMERGLIYGSLGTANRNPSCLKVWRAIAKDLIDHTQAGVWFTAPGRRRPVLEKDTRFSEGAADLWCRGTPLLGGGATFVVQLGLRLE